MKLAYSLLKFTPNSTCRSSPSTRQLLLNLQMLYQQQRGLLERLKLLESRRRSQPVHNEEFVNPDFVTFAFSPTGTLGASYETLFILWVWDVDGRVFNHLVFDHFCKNKNVFAAAWCMRSWTKIFLCILLRVASPWHSTVLQFLEGNAA